MKKKLTINNVKQKKFNKPLVCLTAYTTPMAQILDKYCDVILVGERTIRIGLFTSLYLDQNFTDSLTLKLNLKNLKNH